MDDIIIKRIILEKAQFTLLQSGYNPALCADKWLQTNQPHPQTNQRTNSQKHKNPFTQTLARLIFFTLLSYRKAWS